MKNQRVKHFKCFTDDFYFTKEGEDFDEYMCTLGARNKIWRTKEEYAANPGAGWKPIKFKNSDVESKVKSINWVEELLFMNTAVWQISYKEMVTVYKNKYPLD